MKHGKLSNHGNQGSHGNQCNHGNITSQGYYVNVINQNTHTCTYEKYLLFVSDLNHNSSVSTNSSKNSQQQFPCFPFRGSRIGSCGQTDGRTERHDEANIRFLQRCCERALSMVCAR